MEGKGMVNEVKMRGLEEVKEMGRVGRGRQRRYMGRSGRQRWRRGGEATGGEDKGTDGEK